MQNRYHFVLKELVATQDIQKGERVNPSNAIPIIVNEQNVLLPHFKVEEIQEGILITDLGPWDLFPTVTNRGKEVVEFLYYHGYIKPGQSLFYIDSEGTKGRILHSDGKFTGFQP